MHPNPAFSTADDAAALAHVSEVAFAHLFVAENARMLVAHAPLLVVDGVLWFHLANSNAMTPLLPGRRALASVGGPGSYISPDWYENPANMVPTWNYRTTEIEGEVQALGRDALEALLVRAAATFEPRVGQGWTMDKMERRRAEAMMGAITGFSMTIDTVRHTDKASQNRSDADAKRLVAAFAAVGDGEGAAQIRRVRGW
ncbi:transcriptional regulator [Polymorphobacter multimanifer]|uniref:Transcriptional regulator n=1 Tax=Polymorphobacter multimanifer TaxID=1070431 RepID=A0A841LE96_9SPHN|nr:transcriptional regulator [Polymorphobacter multimanifer]